MLTLDTSWDLFSIWVCVTIIGGLYLVLLAEFHSPGPWCCGYWSLFARIQAKQARLSLITHIPLSDVNFHITHMHTHLEDQPEWKQTVLRVCWRMMDKNGSTFEVYFGTNTCGYDGHQSFSLRFLQDYPGLSQAVSNLFVCYNTSLFHYVCFSCFLSYLSPNPVFSSYVSWCETALTQNNLFLLNH